MLYFIYSVCLFVFEMINYIETGQSGLNCESELSHWSRTQTRKFSVDIINTIEFLHLLFMKLLHFSFYLIILIDKRKSTYLCLTVLSMMTVVYKKEQNKIHDIYELQIINLINYLH